MRAQSQDFFSMNSIKEPAMVPSRFIFRRRLINNWSGSNTIQAQKFNLVYNLEPIKEEEEELRVWLLFRVGIKDSTRYLQMAKKSQ